MHPTPFLVSLFLLPALSAALDDAGPLHDQFPLTLQSGSRREALGPLYYSQTAGAQKTWGFPPFFSHHSDPVTEFAETDFLYPVLTWNRFGSQHRFQFFQLFSFAGGESLSEHSVRRFSLFPIYFQQRSDDPDRNYTALFPLYGHLQNRFFRDEVFFVMFPLYVETRKRDVITKNLPLPLFHIRRGIELFGWQLWPLIGREEKAVTTRTNSLDEVEVVPGHKKLFVLWPIFFKNSLGIGGDNPQEQRLLLPFYAIQRSPARDTTSIPWPLGFTYTVDRAAKYREWGSPWPFIVFSRGESRTINRVFPLFSQARTATLQSDFYLWPLYKYNRITSAPLDRERTRILLFLYSDTIERNTETGTSFERTDFWPFFTSRREHSGDERLQLFAPLEPLLPNSASIERNYSPLWSVWRSEKNARTGARSQSLLWNLYRYEAQPDSKKLSLLFGLIQYQSAPESRRWRLLYIPFGTKKPGENPAPGS